MGIASSSSRRAILALLVAGVPPEALASGGTLFGLFPKLKRLQGKVKDNTYYAPNGVLQVRLPFATDSYEYKYMEVREQFTKQTGVVSFGPAAFDRGLYRVEVIERLDGDESKSAFEIGGPQLVDQALTFLEKNFRAPLTEAARDSSPIQGKPTFRATAKQTVPPGLMASNEQMYLHHIFAIHFGKKVAVAVVARPTESFANPPALQAVEFASSIVVP